jgi:hypothetical protein
MQSLGHVLFVEHPVLPTRLLETGTRAVLDSGCNLL